MIKKNKTLLTGIVLIMVLLLAGCSRGLSAGLHEISNAEFAVVLADRSSDGTWVYIGRPTCRYCRRMEPNIRQTLETLNQPMYYFQTASARYENEDRMLELLEPLDIPGIPIIVHIVDGEVADYLIGVHTTEVITEFLTSND